MEVARLFVVFVITITKQLTGNKLMVNKTLIQRCLFNDFPILLALSQERLIISNISIYQIVENFI